MKLKKMKNKLSLGLGAFEIKKSEEMMFKINSQYLEMEI